MKLSYCDQSNRVWSIMKTKQDNNVSNCIGQVYVEIEIGMNLSNWVWSRIKIRQDNDMIDHTNAIYAKNKTKLP